MRTKLFGIGAAFIFFLSGCGSSEPAPAKKAEAPKPAAPVSGQSAAFLMFQQARLWAPDAQLLRLESVQVPEVKPEPGKTGAWRANFVSIEKKAQKSYTYSVVKSEGLHKGVFAQTEMPWLRSSAVKPYYVVAIKTDTPAALATALKQKDIAAYAEKNPEMPVQYLAEWTPQTPNVAWRVYWGPTVSASAASVFVDATSGEFLKKAR